MEGAGGICWYWAKYRKIGKQKIEKISLIHVNTALNSIERQRAQRLNKQDQNMKNISN